VTATLHRLSMAITSKDATSSLRHDDHKNYNNHNHNDNCEDNENDNEQLEEHNDDHDNNTTGKDHPISTGMFSYVTPNDKVAICYISL